MTAIIISLYTVFDDSYYTRQIPIPHWDNNDILKVKCFDFFAFEDIF